MNKYRQAIIDLDREEPHDRPKDLELLNEAIEVLEIIKVKQVDIEFIGLCADEERYNRAFVPEDDDRKLTQDEFDKVKAWLKKCLVEMK
jgi:hypothetical protein